MPHGVTKEKNKNSKRKGKHLEENITTNLGDLGFDNGFFYMASKAQTITTTDKWDFTNIEICASKDTAKNEKTTCRVGENTCRYKELLSKYTI